ncbi:MAG: HAMP domain-containing protein [Bacteroidota bacterium]
MQTSTSIYHKLILYIFFLGIFVIVAVSLYSFITARNAILQRTFYQLTSIRVAKKEQVEQFFSDRVKEAELFSNQENSGFFHIRTKRLDGLISLNFPVNGLDANFKKFFEAGSYYKRVYIIRKKGTECYNFETVSSGLSSPEKKNTQEFEPLLARVRSEKHTIITDYSLRTADSSVHLYIASPMTNSGPDDPGIAIFEIDPSAINNIMKNKETANGLGKSGEVYLVGPDSLSRSESRFFKNAILHLKVKTQSVRNAYKPAEGAQLNKDYRGISTLSSYSSLAIPGLNWVIIAEIDSREAMRPVYKLANEIVFLSIFITLILFLAAYIISRAIAGPIIELKNATIRVRQGDLEPLLLIKSNDELGELTENFNLMTSQLKAQQEELKEREVRMFTSFIDGQEDERQRLSRELHDGLGQMIIATKLKTESMMNTGNGINSGNMSRLREMFDSLVDEVRSISNNLMPAVLQEFGLEIALNQICKEIEKHSRIKVIFDSRIPVGDLDKRITTYVFRIAQEALNNAVKHSEASEIIMTLIGNERMINLLVQDDGIGINLSEPCNQNGRGLNSMCERVKLLNGLIDISKGENHGTIVSVKIPLI